MPTPYASATVPAPADDVWRVVRDFNGLPTWHPAIESSELESDAGVGAVRRLALGDGGVVREKLISLDDADRRYTYDIIESPFPLRRYRATIRVAPITATGEAFVEWWTEFDAEAADESPLSSTFADAVFAGGLRALAEHFG